MEVESHFVEHYSPEDSSVVELVEMGYLVGNWQVMCHPSEAQGDIQVALVHKFDMVLWGS